ncbi:MAG: molybdopterin-dependent oxidoreductase [Actinomycetia bacterium]|nr:molybdopterin-dependent oxidoreductase [Actinomycetes bacterium]
MMVDPPRSEGPAVVGTAFERLGGRERVTGETVYADDLTFPRMVHLALTRATIPHGRIIGVDTSKALEMPGVLGVLTGADLPTPYGIFPISQDEHALCGEKVRFVGDPVAAVAALTEEEAQHAALAVEVTYEPLATISTIEEALEPFDTIHDTGRENNVHRLSSFTFGDVEAGFSEADEILEDLFFYEGNTHLALEQHSAVAVPEGEDRVTVYASTQVPHYLHRALTQVLGLEAAKVRVVASPTGGGFGGKTDPLNHEIVVAAMALHLGRPVRCTLSREEVFYCHRGRHPAKMRLRTGFRRDGAITGQHLEAAIDGGAYGSYGVASLLYHGALQTTTYRLPRYRFDGSRVFTNKPPCGPKRGHGTPQPRFAFEVQLDKAAERLGIDPADLRLDNLAEAHSVTANWLQLGTVGLRPCIEAVVEGSRWRERRGRLPRGRGLGLACSAYMSGAGLPIVWNQLPHSGVQLHLDRSGGVTVFSGHTEIGQGSDSVLAAIVAETLGLEAGDVRVARGDTALTPVDLGSYSSRVTLMAGNAALQAAERAREIIAASAADELGVGVEGLVFAEGRVFDSSEPARGLDFAAAVAAAEERNGTLGTTGSYTPPRTPARYQGSGVGPSPTYSYSAAVVELEVDEMTGMLTVDHVWIAHDLGTAINPVLARGQVEGSVYMGLGEVLMEEQAFRRLPRRRSDALVHRHPSMLEYKSPTFHEMPEVTTYLIEGPDPAGPFGAKEVGQGPLLPMPPAVANAVADAVGVRIDQVPISPEMVLKALTAHQAGSEARFGPTSFPDLPLGESLRVLTPEEGGDGLSADDGHSPARKPATMPTREEASKGAESASTSSL